MLLKQQGGLMCPLNTCSNKLQRIHTTQTHITNKMQLKSQRPHLMQYIQTILTKLNKLQTERQSHKYQIHEEDKPLNTVHHQNHDHHILVLYIHRKVLVMLFD